MGMDEKIQEHEGLVHYMIQQVFKSSDKLQYTMSARGIEYDDVFQIGLIGLWQALKTFDESKGIKFGTYASKCIRNKLFRDVIHSLPFKGFPPKIDLKDKVKMSFQLDIDERKVKKKCQKISKFENDLIHNMIFDNNRTGLTEREEKVLSMRLDGYTYEQIGEQFGCSKQNINNIGNRMRKKLEKIKREFAV